MKYIISGGIVLVLCVVGVIMFATRRGASPDALYQHYFMHCMENAEKSKLDAEIADETCDCVATAIIKGGVRPDDLTQEELQDIAITCLGIHFQTK
ncbi:hypothetical protein HDR66_02490 [bacterium]|nr:hypothetical protein [bacterium]